MKTYFEPIMSITAFDNEDIITTSGGDLSAKFVTGGSSNSFKSVKFNDLETLTEFTEADTHIN